MTLLAGLVLATLSGCTRLRYYAHLAGGQWQLLHERHPIAEVLASPDTAPELKARLQQVVQARSWAVGALHLPDNGSYRNYADLGRPYVMWNVFATPELSLKPLEHCFLFAGCVAYQGYYERAQAEARAADLRAEGYDVYVGGVPAYSTLGWFDDPVLNTMMRWDDAQLVGTVFHELAHQKLYVQDDTRFNESYAAFVQQEGLRAYTAAHPQLPAGDEAAQPRRTQFVRLVLDLRQRLNELYAQPLDLETMRARKSEEFARLRADYERLRDADWNGDRRYDAWFADITPNNARLLPFGLYDEYEPAFAALFERAGRDWTRFHVEAQQLAELPADQRKAQLDQLLPLL
ncbi:MAG: aminopeptidase [Sinimarinibacterium sp.]